MSSPRPELLIPRHEAFLRRQPVGRPLLGAWVGGYYPSRLWARRPVSYYQDDFAALINPELFAEYLLPLARMTKPTAEVHFIHLHSSRLYMLDALLADDTFSVIEVNLDHPDSGPALGEYVPALKRIQGADRPPLLWGEIDQEGWSLLKRELEPAGLSIQPIVKHPEDILSYR